VTKDVDQTYLYYLENLRKDDEVKLNNQNEVENLDIYNEG
ncbi:amidophosphoribosyltransferase, partial [Enterobacter hormaechei]|nr:amidophosphoribosyltransferase [Enterobacter hormaechei]